MYLSPHLWIVKQQNQISLTNPTISEANQLDYSAIDPKKNIIIRGAKVHNLKNVSVVIPRNKLVVITGLSGSGKSSLAFDTLYAEGQRRYVESLSSYARQFLGRLDKPEVDGIDGISPAIAIEQKVTSRSSRSTVGTSTEIYDYIKLMYARIGKTFSPISGEEVKGCQHFCPKSVQFFEILILSCLSCQNCHRLWLVGSHSIWWGEAIDCSTTRQHF